MMKVTITRIDRYDLLASEVETVEVPIHSTLKEVADIYFEGECPEYSENFDILVVDGEEEGFIFAFYNPKNMLKVSLTSKQL